jgi:hypothetical protein
MAMKTAQASRVAVGLLNASGYTKGYSLTAQTAALDTTVLTDAAKTFIVGQDESSGSLDMLFDTVGTTALQFDAFKSQKATGPYPLTLCPDGFAVGQVAVMVNAHLGNFTGASSVSDLVTCSAAFQSTGNFDVGLVVEDFTAITADTSGTARDQTAATANGGVAHIHVTAFSGLTNNACRIEHSVDGSTGWATLVTFATYTGVTSERVEVADGTTVRRYLRVVDDVTGTGSTTRFVSFARR